MAIEYRRKVIVTIDDLIFFQPKIEFEIKKESSGTPTAGSVTLFNLSRDSEKQIIDKRQKIEIQAGYEDRTSIIFSGSIQRIEREKNRQDNTRKTIITLGPSIISSEMLNGISVISFTGIRSLKSVVSLLVSDSGSILGPLDAIPDAEVVDFSWDSTISKGLTHLLKDHKVTWFEEDGVLRFNSPALAQQSDSITVNLSNDTGLIGAPTVLENDGVRVKSIMKSEAKIGGGVLLFSETVSGYYKIVTLLYKGDNWTSNDFSTEYELRPSTEFVL